MVSVLGVGMVWWMHWVVGCLVLKRRLVERQRVWVVARTLIVARDDQLGSSRLGLKAGLPRSYWSSISKHCILEQCMSKQCMLEQCISKQCTILEQGILEQCISEQCTILKQCISEQCISEQCISEQCISEQCC